MILVLHVEGHANKRHSPNICRFLAVRFWLGDWQFCKWNWWKILDLKPTNDHKEVVWACWRWFFGGEGDDHEHCWKRVRRRAQFSKILREVRRKLGPMYLYAAVAVPHFLHSVPTQWTYGLRTHWNFETLSFKNVKMDLTRRKNWHRQRWLLRVNRGEALTDEGKKVSEKLGWLLIQ